MDTLAQKRYEELANKLVALGIAEGPNNYAAYSLNKEVRVWMSSYAFVSDARVMAATLELVCNTSLTAWCQLMRELMYERNAKNISLSITATCVELLEGLK